MGFDLNCVLTLSDDVFALYEKVMPRGSRYALRAEGPGLPDGWVLPVPWELEYGAGLTAAPAKALEPADPDAWRAAAGVPEETDPLGAFDDYDFQLISFLSLAAPVVLISDSTFGGVLFHEYAAVCVNGRLEAAYGIDFRDSAAFALEEGVHRSVEPGAVDPATQCATLLDERFRGGFLFDGYLPRSANREGPPSREPWSGPMPDVDPAWRRLFPDLTTG